MNTSHLFSPTIADITCIRILDRLECKKAANIGRVVPYTINLNDAKMMPVRPDSLDEKVSNSFAIPHTTGTLVSADMTIPMMSAAHHSPHTFQAILDLMGSDTADTCFCCLKIKEDCTAKDAFLALVVNSRLLLGVSVMVKESSNERLIVVCPPDNMKLTQTDAIIALKR